MVKFLYSDKFVEIDHEGRPESLYVEVYHCDKCNQMFWQSMSRQECLRKEVECPMCKTKKSRKAKKILRPILALLLEAIAMAIGVVLWCILTSPLYHKGFIPGFLYGSVGGGIGFALARIATRIFMEKTRYWI